MGQEANILKPKEAKKAKISARIRVYSATVVEFLKVANLSPQFQIKSLIN